MVSFQIALIWILPSLCQFLIWILFLFFRDVQVPHSVIWDCFVFIMWAFMAMNFPVGIAFIVFHRFENVLQSFLFDSNMFYFLF